MYKKLCKGFGHIDGTYTPNPNMNESIDYTSLRSLKFKLEEQLS